MYIFSIQIKSKDLFLIGSIILKILYNFKFKVKDEIMRDTWLKLLLQLLQYIKP